MADSMVPPAKRSKRCARVCLAASLDFDAFWRKLPVLSCPSTQLLHLKNVASGQIPETCSKSK